MGLKLETVEYYDNSGGLDLKSSPTKIVEDTASNCLNVDYSTDGAVFTRNGSSIVNVSGGIPAQMSGAPRTLNLFDYRKSDGTAVQIVCAGTTIKHSLTAPTNAVTGLSGALPIPDIEFQVTNDDEYAFWGNGVDPNLKFDGTTWTNWSLPRPSAPVPVDNGAGVLGAGAYDYYFSYARLVLGVIVQEGELSPVGSVTIGANRQIRVPISVSSDPQVNARVIYRKSPTSSGVIYRLATVADNTSTFYDDNTLADGTIEAEFDNQAAPVTAVFEEYLGYMFMVDASSKSDVYYSKKDKPWNVPTENFFIFDGAVQCIRRAYGALIFGTDRSLWVLNGDPATNSPRRISSIIGIYNNRCAVGEDSLYILGTNKKVYNIKPTDFSQSEMRLDTPISTLIEPFLNQISASGSDQVCMEYYTSPTVAKVVISCPIGGSANNYLIILNETQSSLKGKPVWQVWDNINASALRQFVISGTIGLYSGDYNGFLWKLDDTSKNGDGAEENGIVTAATATTLTDSTKTWTVNAFAGMRVRVIDGTGENQVRTIASNTATQITVSSAWGTTPDVTSEYTIGGYDVYHYTNWKSVLGSYDILKQLWFIWINANASGNYNINLIIQIDFDQTITNQTTLLLNLSSGNTIWGSFIWGAAIWGARSVFQDRLRQYSRFRAIRLGFYHRKAGQPFQINGFSLSAQNKGLFFSAAA